MGGSIQMDEMIKKAFDLAYFIHCDKQTSLRVANESLLKIEVAVAAQDKRLYYTPKRYQLTGNEQTGGFRTKMSLSELQLLQRLVYIESEPYEKQREQEEGARAIDEESLAIHFVKHLVRMTIKRNSFYVALGVNRLLHKYSTAESMEIYNLVIQDPNRVKDDYYYRSRKGVLMQEMKRRFGSFLTTSKGPRGEERFKAHEHSGRFNDLISVCLSKFTPWGTACPLPSLFDPMADVIGTLCSAGGAPDEEHKIEVNRFHALLHPECYSRLIQALGFDNPDSRMEIPSFNFSGSNSQRPPGSRRDPPELSEEEMMAIRGSLAEAAARRKMATGGWLRIMVDGYECARLDPKQDRTIQFEVDEGAEMIEVHARRGDENVLLAVCVMPSNEMTDAESAWKRLIVLEGGQTIAFAISPLADNEREIFGAAVVVNYSKANSFKTVLLRLRQFLFPISEAFDAKNRSRRATLKPVLALGLLALCSAITLYTVKRALDGPVVVVDERAANGEGKSQSKSPDFSNNKRADLPVSDQATIGSNKNRGTTQIRRPDSNPQMTARVFTKDLAFIREFDPAQGSGAQHTRGSKSPPGSLGKVRKIYVQTFSNDSLSSHVHDLLINQFERGQSLTASNDREEADAALRFIAKRKPKAGPGSRQVMSITVQLVDESLNVIWPQTPGVEGRRYTGTLQKATEKIVEDLIEDFRKLKKE